MANEKGSSKESKLRRYMKALVRLLSKARDLYVQGMSECSSHMAYVDTTMGCPAGQLSTLPRSFSVASTRSSASDDDFKELVRVASVRSHGNRLELDLGRKQPAAAVKVPRSRSVGIGRIDEDKQCDFGDDINVKPYFYPRSRSYAVHGRGAGVF